MCRPGRPYLDIPVARRPVEPDREQVPREDPLNRFVDADVERHPDRIRIVTPVVQTCRQGDSAMPGNNERQAKLRCDDRAGIHSLAKPLLRPAPGSPGNWRPALRRGGEGPDEEIVRVRRSSCG